MADDKKKEGGGVSADFAAGKEAAIKFFEETLKPSAENAKQSAGDYYNNTLKPSIEKFVKGTSGAANNEYEAGRQSVIKFYEEKLKPTAENAKKTAGEYYNDTMKSLSKFALDADEKSGGFIGKNKGLLIGGAVALFAMFGMDGGFMPLMIALIAVLGGALHDKEDGIFGGFLHGKKDEPAQGQGKGKGKGDAAPSRAAEEPAKVPPPRSALPGELIDRNFVDAASVIPKTDAKTTMVSSAQDVSGNSLGGFSSPFTVASTNQEKTARIS